MATADARSTSQIVLLPPLPRWESRVGDLTRRSHRPKSDSTTWDDNEWWVQPLKSLETQQECTQTVQDGKFGCFGRPMDPDEDESIELAFLNSLGSSDTWDTLSSELNRETHSLIGSAERVEPWWRTADTNELASLVAQKSLEYVENCDLQQPQVKHIRKPPPCSSFPLFQHCRIPASTLDQKLPRHHVYGTATIDKDRGETKHIPDSDSGQDSFLDALRRSQTRARKAKEEAQLLQIERDHIVKLILKQASQLFAYRQWLQILQLESLRLRVEKNDPGPHNHDSVVAFALGLSLAGVGLLLGWTTACSFPAFSCCYVTHIFPSLHTISRCLPTSIYPRVSKL